MSRFPTTTVQHGQQMCYKIQYSNGAAGVNCEIRNFDADIVLPDGTVIPMLLGATIVSGGAVSCPGDARCVTASNCTIAGQVGYRYIVRHVDEVLSFSNCPPVTVAGIGKVVAYTDGFGDALSDPQDVASACATSNIIVRHACCEPCAGTCTDVSSASKCPFPSVFTADKSCAEAACTPLNCSGFTNQCNDSRCNPATGLCEPVPRPLSTPCEVESPANLCTIDHCDGLGNCVLLSPRTCPGAVPPCEGGERCNPTTGLCVEQNDAPVSTPCEAENPPNLCTNDHCNGQGLCVFLGCKPPSITCPPDKVFECDAVGGFGDPTVVDSCSVAPMVECTEVSTPGKLPQERTIIRTCTATNDCGATDQCEQRIDIVDTTPPTVTCPPDCTLECGDVQCVPPECDDPSCECGGVATCEDNCSTCTVSVTCEVVPKDCTAVQVAGLTPPPKLTVVRTYSGTEAAAGATATGQGNIGTCVQRIEIVDSIPPVLDPAICSSTITICAGAELSFTPPTCTDTCGTCSVICVRSDHQSFPGPAPNGPITVTCVSSDECRNESSCDINVEISDSAECFKVIPTMSEWGLVILTLLLLTGAKIFFGRRQVAAV